MSDRVYTLVTPWQANVECAPSGVAAGLRQSADNVHKVSVDCDQSREDRSDSKIDAIACTRDR